ncbi:MAG TPA: Gfo/Idh/MocA family oxidoreductase [Sedimentisphaerales bacterium]|nr:Gfo/Idh/MocA family oxidoreductase [Sedimentisphaerales bacterium]
MQKKEQQDEKLSRRDFVKAAAAASFAGVSPVLTGKIRAAGSDILKVGLIGCGGRGTGAATQALMGVDKSVRLWAMADLFQDKLDASYNMLSKGAKGRYDRVDFEGLAGQMDVPERRRFVGFDAYQGLIDSGVDMVILATPPHFRPEHFEAAVKAGKHVFMEKPAAVDPVGIRRVISAAKLAEEKGLSVVAGTQRRHQLHYIEILKRIHNGAIGEIVAAQCYWNGGGGSLTRKKPEGMSDMEWQCRRWYYFCWLCGDHIAEQHVHNIDIMNWALQGHPVSAMGVGGRAVREGGNIWDHFAVEFEYPGGVRVLSMCRQIPRCTDRVSERIVGTKGFAYIDGSHGFIKGESSYEGPASPNPYVQEHVDLIQSIRKGAGLNEGVQVAESTMCAIMGRMSAYTGRALKWDWAMKASKLDLSPEKYEFGDLPVRPVAVPGKTMLI